MEIDIALNGKLGLDFVKRRQQQVPTNLCYYNFIFLDIQMPVLDGYKVRMIVINFQTAEKLKKMDKKGEINLINTQIIALSAITENQFKQNTINKNLFNDFSKA